MIWNLNGEIFIDADPKENVINKRNPLEFEGVIYYKANLKR